MLQLSCKFCEAALSTKSLLSHLLMKPFSLLPIVNTIEKHRELNFV